MNKALYLPEAKNDFIFTVVGKPWSLLLIAAGILAVCLWLRWKNR